MKRIVTLLVLVCCFQSVNAQSWAAPGATWYYSFQYFAQIGYERIQNTGDTMINSLQYNKLQIYRNYYDQSNQQSGSYFENFLQFTREDSGVVYGYHDSADFVLYDFNTPAGGHWVTHGNWPAQTGICDTGSVYVDSVTTVVINGDTLRKLYMNNSGGMLTFTGPIIEKIGCVGYLFPYQNCMPDVPEGFGLRCYDDSSGWSYHDPSQAAYINMYGCAYVTGIPSVQWNAALRVFPDPANDVLHLDFPAMNFSMEHVCIEDAEGRFVKNLNLETAENIIHVNDLAPGMYFITSPGNEFSPVKFAVAR